ncbi:MAG: NAD(P)/FAD-dependent oxidoreductase [Candidatus Doudnabacteria bacterium]
MKQMTKIVIIGGGFGGLRTALDLEKQFKKDPNIQIVLVDKRDYHLFTPNLFEVATADEELTTIKQIKKSITLPFAEILAGKKIQFVQGECLNIDSAQKKVQLPGRTLLYDFLILASGSESDYYGILGAKEFGLPLKTLSDALRIRNKIEFVFQAKALDFTKKNLHFAIAGGGYSGTEVAGELKGLLDFLAWKYNYPREKIEIVVVEAANKLVEGFDDRLSIDVYNRLQELGVHVRISSRISKVDQNFIELMSGEKLAYDALIWTAGVKGVSPECINGLSLERKSRVCVNQFLQAKNLDNVITIGDTACVIGIDGKPVFGSAQNAIDQGKYVAQVLPYLMKNKKPPYVYKNKPHGFIVSLGGKWAILDYNNFYFKGFIAYFMKTLANFRYFASLIGIIKAIKLTWFDTELYSRND